MDNQLNSYLLRYSKLQERAINSKDPQKYKTKFDSIHSGLQKKLKQMNITRYIQKFEYGDTEPNIKNSIDKLNRFKPRKKDDKPKDDKPHVRIGYTPSKPLRASHIKIDSDDTMRARLLKAGRLVKKSGDKGLTGNEKYIDAEMYLGNYDNTKDFKIDKELSNNEALVLEKNGKYEVAYRGTEGTDLEDWKTNFNIARGKEASTPQFLDADDVMAKSISKYGRENIHVSGFSKGGAKASYLGEKYDLPTTLFNPFMGKNYIKGKHLHTPQRILRTTEDMASSPLLLGGGDHNFDIRNYYPTIGNGNPKSIHNLDNFTQQRLDNDDLQEFLNNATQEVNNNIEKVSVNSKKLVDIEGLHTANNYVNGNETFSQYVKDYKNDGVSNLHTQEVNSKTIIKPNMIHSKDSLIKHWRDAGGNFTEDEIKNISISKNVPDKIKILKDNLKIKMGNSTELNELLDTLTPANYNNKTFMNRFQNQTSALYHQVPLSGPEIELDTISITPPQNNSTQPLSLDDRINNLRMTNEPENINMKMESITNQLQNRVKSDFNSTRQKHINNNPDMNINNEDYLEFQSIEKEMSRLNALMSNNKLDGRGWINQYDIQETPEPKVTIENKRLNTIIDMNETEHSNLDMDTRNDFLNKPYNEKTEHISKLTDNLLTSQDNLDDALNIDPDLILADEVYKPTSGISSMGAGLVGGILSNRAINFIDPNKKINRPTRDALEGAGTGALGVLGMGAFGNPVTASVLGPEILAGGASYIAGDYAGTGFYDWGKKNQIFDDETDAQKSSYEVGGVAAGATGVAVASATGALFGGEIGALGGPLGIVLGGAVGGLFGLGGYYWNKYIKI